jgi:hypothetical protein
MRPRGEGVIIPTLDALEREVFDNFKDAGEVRIITNAEYAALVNAVDVLTSVSNKRAQGF